MPSYLPSTCSSAAAVAVDPLVELVSLLVGCFTLVAFTRWLQKDRWSLLRCSNFAWIRNIYQSLAIYNFAWRLDRAFHRLPPPIDALEILPGASKVLDEILANGPDTYQKKPSNRLQIESLMDCVCKLVLNVQKDSSAATTSTPLVLNVQKNSSAATTTTTTPLVLDIGAGKALFSRALYEALDRQVAVVALDSRRPHEGDQFYDPINPAKEITKVAPVEVGEDAPYTRVVADVRYLAARTLVPLQKAKNGGVIAITKHLCGGATDGSLIALCAPPLDEFVGACCFAPCCHQKTRRNQYCNIPYLESLGFCKTHIGLRGGVQDVDFRNFGMLISMSKNQAADFLEFEYKKSILLKVLGIKRARQLGHQARRLLEEGRMRYLREHGFEAHLVRYCDASITGDNLAIIATKSTIRPAAAAANKVIL
jgi:hypothetical protein